MTFIPEPLIAEPGEKEALALRFLRLALEATARGEIPLEIPPRAAGVLAEALRSREARQGC